MAVCLSVPQPLPGITAAPTLFFQFNMRLRVSLRLVTFEGLPSSQKQFSPSRMEADYQFCDWRADISEDVRGPYVCVSYLHFFCKHTDVSQHLLIYTDPRKVKKETDVTKI